MSTHTDNSAARRSTREGPPLSARACYVLAVGALGWSGMAAIGIAPTIAGLSPTGLFVTATGLWIAGWVLDRPRTRGQEGTSGGNEGDLDLEALSFVDRQILEKEEAQREAEAERASEAEVWPLLEPEKLDDSLGSSRPIRITFDDLSRTSPLLAKSIRAQMDNGRIPPRDPDTIASKRRRDRYHVRADGPRYDLRILRSV